MDANTNLWASQVSALGRRRANRIQAACHAEIHTSNAGQALLREQAILQLLQKHGAQNVTWIASHMSWTVGGARRRLNQMLDKGMVTALRTWPRTWKAKS